MRARRMRAHVRRVVTARRRLGRRVHGRTRLPERGGRFRAALLLARVCARLALGPRTRGAPLRRAALACAVAAPRARGVWRARASAEFEAAIARNRAFKKTHLRGLRRKRLAALDGEALRELRHTWVRALNIDVAILYASSLLAGSLTTFDTGLPGAVPGWRDGAAARRAARFVAGLCDDEPLVVDRFDAHPLLTRTKRKALALREALWPAA